MFLIIGGRSVRSGRGLRSDGVDGWPIGAVEANRIALVDKLAEPGSAVDEALVLAERVAKNAPLALAASAYILRESQGRTEEEFWKFQGPQMGKVFFSEDAKEGPRSSAEKRPPNWQGK